MTTQLRSVRREKSLPLRKIATVIRQTMMTTHVMTVASELLVVVSSGTAALLQVLLFCAWLNERYPQHAKSLAPIIEELQAVQQQHNALVTATRRREFARLVFRLHELDGKVDGLGNDLKILRQSVASAVWRRRDSMQVKDKQFVANIFPGGLMSPRKHFSHFSQWGWLYSILVLLSLTLLASLTILTVGGAYFVLAALVLVPMCVFASFVHWLWSNS